MLVDLSRAVGGYLHEVFLGHLDWWIALGYVAQIFFFMRFFVQWIASERAGKSVVPMSFWLFSIGGGFLLFYCEPHLQDRLRSELHELAELPFSFDMEGSKVIHVGSDRW